MMEFLSESRGLISNCQGGNMIIGRYKVGIDYKGLYLDGLISYEEYKQYQMDMQILKDSINKRYRLGVTRSN